MFIFVLDAGLIGSLSCQATMASQIVIDEMEAASTLTPVESSANQWQRISRFHKLFELIEDVADVYYLCIYIIIYNYIIYYNYICI